MFKKYSNIYQFKKYYLQHKELIAILFLVMILASSLGMILPYLYSQRLIGITEITSNIVVNFSILILVTIFFHHLFWYLWEKLASILTNKVSYNIQKDVINYILHTKYIDIKDKTSGYYLERLNEDVIDVSSFFANVLGTLVDILTNVSFLIFIFILNYQCGIILTLGIVWLYVVDCIKIKRDLFYTKQIKILQEQISSKTNEIFKGIKDIKGLGIEEHILNNTSNISYLLSSAKIKKDNEIAILNRLKTFSQYVLESILILYCIIYLIPQGNLAVVGLLMIINYSGFLYELIGCVAIIKDSFYKCDYKASRLLEVMNNNTIQTYGNVNKITKNNITVKNLSYKYKDNDYYTLKNLSFDIEPYTISVFLGKSGSGKSTLFGILSHLLPIDNDTVFIGNIDINKLSSNALDKYISIINQEPFLLNDSIINNLKIANPTVNIQDVYDACKLANIHNDILTFSNKYETIITENGSNLSGGQKQRLAIARALLKGCPILLFDEPTSALDKENQDLFDKTINKLRKSKTILIITHKLSNTKRVDNIFELNNGILQKTN